MAALKVVGALIALVSTAPADAGSVADWRPYIVEASLRFGLPAVWIEHVMQAESGGRTGLDGRPIRSSAGAIGLMQLMPGTWTATRQTLGLGSNPDDPRDNILAGTFFLRLMYDRFGYPGLFAAYNVGPGRYASHLATGIPLPDETIAYLRSVAGMTIAASAGTTGHPHDRLFSLLRDGRPRSLPARDDGLPDGLLLIRHDGG